MRKRDLGKHGMQASVVAFGAWAIGGWKWGGSDAEASVAAVRASLDAGVDFIDTAAVYGFGLSEEIVGTAIQGRVREDIIVATKCGLRWDIETPTLHAESEGKRIFRTLDADSIRWEIRESLKRLGTDYIDLYQTHWPDPEMDIAEVVGTLDELQNEGLIRAWGLCNETSQQLAKAAGLGRLATDQADTDLRHGNPRFAPPVLDAIQAVLAPVKALARDRNVSVEQLVLAWTLDQPGVSHVLVGTRDVDQAASNALAGSIELDEDEMGIVSQAANAWPGFAELS